MAFPQACSAGGALQLPPSLDFSRQAGRLDAAPRPDRLSAAISPENPIMKRTGQNGGHVSLAKEGPEAALDRRLLLLALQSVRSGDFSVRLPNDWSGIDGKIADTFNEIVQGYQKIDQELKRVGQVVGKEGRTRERTRFDYSKGAWGEMEGSVNTLIDDLLRPTTEFTGAIAAVAKGNLTQTMRLDVDGRMLEGEFLRSASIVNTMIQQLGVFTSEVTRVAREVGSDGKLGGQAQVPGMSGVWKDLTESVNSMASNLTAQVRNISEVTIAVANGDLSRKITVDVRGEILQLKEAINTMVDQLRSFASEVTRVAREVGTEGKLGGQAVGTRCRRHLEGPDRQRERHGGQPDGPGAQHRGGDDGRRPRRPVQEDHRQRERRDPGAQGHHQHDGGSAQRTRERGDARRPRGRYRRETRRPGAGARSRRDVEGPDRQRELHGE
jgi:HAMP domain-containing protein